MKKYFTLTFLFILAATYVFGQSSEKKDSSEIKIRGTGIYFIDGFRVYTKLTKNDSINILNEFVSKLNGRWTSDKKVHTIKLSNQTFSGTWYTNGIHSTAPLIRLALINGQVKLIVTDLIGGNEAPRNIRVDEKTVTIESAEGKGTFCYKKLKTDRHP